MKCSGCGRDVPSNILLVVAARGAPLKCSACGTVDSVPFKEVQSALRAQLDNGASCPCCTQFAKRYKRKLNAGMARSLLHFYRWSAEKADSNGWAGVGKDHMTKQMCMTYHQGEFHKLRWWGLVEQQSTVRVEGHRSEFWRLTELGREFALEAATVQSHALVFRNLCEGFDGDPISIRQALGSKFNYDELMAKG